MATRTRSASGKKSSGKKSNDSAKSVSVTFEREKETPGTVRFKEQADEPQIGTLYVKKVTDKKLGSPKRVKVRVEVV
jgi:hypothetical protein